LMVRQLMRRCRSILRIGQCSRSGVGSTVPAADLNKDGAMDVATSTNRGTFIFWRDA
jgi:hypothetical protein